ncbi:MAG: HD-GYP domain-containing protein [Burkholderiales bacterium]|nr:HD-GYP domain-containing protein [Burkholderiales bacterium]
MGTESPTSQAKGERVQEQLQASLLVLAWMVEARDPYTGGHLWRVSRYSALLCEAIGLPAVETARIAIGGFLHDLGKVAVPDAILRKPGKLNDEEYAVIKTHPTVGARVLAGHPLAEFVADAVLLHHEMPDGRGYPNGFEGEDIPLSARIVGICDAFDAMTSSRPYRAGMQVAQALAIVESQLGRQFDRALGRQFLELGAQGVLNHVAGHSDDWIPLQSCLVCGPTLAIAREQRAGDTLFCPSCGSGYRLEDRHPFALPQVVPTGSRATANDLAPRADTALIERFVRDTAQALVTEGNR